MSTCLDTLNILTSSRTKTTRNVGLATTTTTTTTMHVMVTMHPLIGSLHFPRTLGRGPRMLHTYCALPPTGTEIWS